MKSFTPLVLALAIPSAVLAQQTTVDERIVIIGESMQAPSEWVVDAKKPRQPLPAHDAGDFLKSLAGFSSTRKGGASSDPLFRGMGAGRLAIVTDDQMLLGGCSSRMDPPTAYITPQSYDSVTVIKGPQTVLYSGSAASIHFERDITRFDDHEFSGLLNATTASFGRVNGSADMTWGSAAGFVRLNATAATADDYQDGSDREINSQYERWSGDVDLAWTPSDNQRLMLKFGASDGEAAYADRSMDGVLFKRESMSLDYNWQPKGSHLEEVSVNTYFNSIDHVMDNYSLRDFTPSMMMPNPTARNPDRHSRGAKVTSEWSLTASSGLKAGVEHHESEHRDRISRNQLNMPYQNLPRIDDAAFSQDAFYAEYDYAIDAVWKVVTGFRLDHWSITDKRDMLMVMGSPAQPNPTANEARSDNLHSGFVRVERKFDNGYWYAGWGQAERFPDYWEVIGNNRRSPSSQSAFNTDAETNQQWDIGLNWKADKLTLESSLFFSEVDDFILLEKGMMMQPEMVRNIDARSWGGELTSRYQLSTPWSVSAAIAIVRGTNTTDDSYLPQQPADELRLASDYRLGEFTYSVLWRLVKEQDRVAPNQGNVIGYDLEKSAGFGVLSANIDWEVDSQWQISLGVDNILDKTYAEHLSRSASSISGYEQIDKVNEPGRTFWLQTNYNF
ncbi:TonB-dependent copper receptor [uncultured Idiomarina sp.]|uniref:TonB-dependent copper receptor n=1 Tax=uncultured Idiomarina sp. TaxID=352961 RepID=UPI002592A0DA|nr:TonB-dependent copper receptor [uncultured Idiomarina sp.]